MNCISDPKAMHPTSCSENERREEKQPQRWGYDERSRRSWYPDAPPKTDDRRLRSTFLSTTIDNIPFKVSSRMSLNTGAPSALTDCFRIWAFNPCISTTSFRFFQVQSILLTCRCQTFTA